MLDRARPRRFRERFWLIAMFFVAWCIAIVLRLAALMLPAIFQTANVHKVQATVAAGIVAAGFLAFEFKRWNQLWYGTVEVGFGIASAFLLAFSTMPSEMHLTQWASLVGCAFVVGRGRNNVEEARAKQDWGREGQAT
jgi:hypothetical protein